MIASHNFFNNGEVGSRLTALRDTEIYNSSANTIENFIITELGNLKIAKAYDTEVFAIDNIIDVVDTKYFFFIIVCTDKIITVNKDDYSILYTLEPITKMNFNIDINVKLIDNILIICGETPYSFEFDELTGAIGVSNFLQLLDFPIKNKEEVKLDIYKVYSVQNELRVSLLSTTENPILESREDGIYYYSNDMKISRIYSTYKASITEDHISNISEGLVFGVIYKFIKNEDNKSYTLGNKNISFTEGITDEKYGGIYYTKMSEITTGSLDYGTLVEINSNIVDVGVFGDRLLLINDGYFYLSEKDNYFNFRNGTLSTDPFFFKPNPIMNISPIIYNIKIGNQCFVSTNKGVYVISYNQVLTASSYSVFIAGDTPSTFINELISSTFYFLTPTNELKCVQPLPNSFGYEDYVMYTVEKYDIRKDIKSLTTVLLDGKRVLVANTNEKLYFYDTIDYNIFRRVTYILSDDTLFGYNSDFISNNKLFKLSDKNVKEASVKLNPPNIKLDRGGTYLADNASEAQRFIVKILDENSDAIQGLYIVNMERPMTKKEKSDIYSTYKAELTVPVGTGYEIKVITNENSNILELLGIDVKIKPASD